MKAIHKINSVKAFIAVVFIFGIIPITEMYAQHKFYTDKANIHFLSKALIEDIEAENVDVICMVDVDKNQIAFKVPINKFEFEKALMQEHFNENYMESDKYPYATFSGAYTSISDTESDQGDPYKVEVKGKLTIHGVTRDVVEFGTLELKNGQVDLQSEFVVELKDYNVKIPKIMFQNIAKRITVTINANLPHYEQ